MTTPDQSSLHGIPVDSARAYDAGTLGKTPLQVRVWDSASVDALSAHERDVLALAISEFGVHSARAQGLRMAVTTLKSIVNDNQTLFVFGRGSSGDNKFWPSYQILAGLKTGYKNLFVFTDKEEYVSTRPLCVLDFYVHESLQRSGIGRLLFEAMLKHTGNLEPVSMAYDRPSGKLIAFLAKHYNLTQQRPQPNNFTIFQGFSPGCADSLDEKSRNQSFGTEFHPSHSGVLTRESSIRASGPASASLERYHCTGSHSDRTKCSQQEADGTTSGMHNS